MAIPEMAEKSIPQGKISYEAFLEWLDEDTLAEWVDGNVVMASPASARHQRIVSFLHRLVSLYVEQRNLGEVIVAPFQMRLTEARSGREPDVLFVANERLARLKDTYLDGPADLVVEVVSPESLFRDRGTKLAEYEVGGVSEYWIIDPERRRADFYQRDAEGYYQRTPLTVDGVYHSREIEGLWLNTNWLWREPLPSPMSAFARVAGLEAELNSLFGCLD